LAVRRLLRATEIQHQIAVNSSSVVNATPVIAQRAIAESWGRKGAGDSGLPRMRPCSVSFVIWRCGVMLHLAHANRAPAATCRDARAIAQGSRPGESRAPSSSSTASMRPRNRPAVSDFFDHIGSRCRHPARRVNRFPARHRP
jgi:hypothetical protein